MIMITLFGSKMDTLTMKETVSTINTRIDKGGLTQHVVVNVAKIVNMQHDTILRNSVNSSDIVNIDGMGLLWGAKLFNNQVTERVSGIDLFYRLLKSSEYEGNGVFLLGATQQVLDKTILNLQQQFPKLKINGSHHGYFSAEQEHTIIDQINQSGAKLLFVAMSSPKKENFINHWKNQLDVNFVMGVGGTFDVVSGLTQRAPLWMQRYGLEWFYRVIQEPKRLWKRYLYTNSKYAFMLFRAYFDKQFRIQGNTSN